MATIATAVSRATWRDGLLYAASTKTSPLMKMVAVPATIALAKLRWIGRSFLSLTCSLPDFLPF
jgi:hypothetical protein